jgi:hypothetical protein
MATVILSTHNVVNFPDGGGHFWVYLQYVEGLRRAGCDVYWLEQFRPDGPVLYENTKRVAFLKFVDLPRLTSQRLELALCLSENDTAERRLQEDHGWNVHDAAAVTGTPETYQTYIQHSRAEFSCAKPSMRSLTDTVPISG